MTIASQSRTAGPFTGTGLLVSYPFAFKIFQTSDLLIQQTDTSGNLTPWVLGANYTVVLNSDQSVSPGGTVTPLVALPVGYTLNMTSAVALTQPASLTNAGGFFPKTIEDALDRLTILIQQALGSFNSTLRVPDIGGVSMLPGPSGRANTFLGFDLNGALITVTTAIGSAASLALQYAGSAGSSLIGFIQALPGAVLRTLQAKGREIKSVGDFGLVGDGSLTTGQMYAAGLVAFNSAITNGHDLYLPDGTYDFGTNNSPFTNPVSTSLLDCKGLTLWCAGPNVILRTTSVNGADVLQLNALKNFNVRGFPTITASVSGSASGSNAVSITNGWDNITLEVRCLNMPGLDKGASIDGGKALTLQNGTTANPCGVLKATVLADGCGEGFGFEPDLVTSATKQTQVDVNIIARNCWVGVKFVAGGASGALSPSMTSGVRVRGQVIDCQHGVLAQRAHGVDIDVQISSTKTAAAKRLSPLGVAWLASDTVVEGVQVAYAKNGKIKVAGNVGACDYKARIGGTGSGSSGLTGSTQDSDIDLDLGGTAAIADLLSLNSGGNSMAGSRLRLSAVTTAAAIPSDWTAATSGNVIERVGKYTGTFTATLSGVSAGGTATANYTIEGDLVSLQFPAGLTGTSNVGTASVSGLPAEIQPTSTQGLVAITTDNGVNLMSRVNVNTNGTMDLFYGPTSGVFTAAGTKGLQFCTLTYRRS